MKINYPQLQAQLARGLSPAYLISGEELLLKQDAFTTLYASAKKAGFTERVRCVIDATFEPEQLYALLYSASLLGDKRIIELDMRHANPNKTIISILTDYLKQPASTHLILIDMGKLEAKISKSAWYQLLEKVGTVITIWPISREQIPQWIMQRAQLAKLSLKLDIAQLISEYTEGNLVAAAQVLEKIALLNDQTPLNAKTVREVLADESRFSLFDFVENVFAGNAARSLHILENLKLEGTEPILILWALTRELRLLAELAEKLKQGNALGGLLQKYRIYFNRQLAFKHFLAKFSAEDCWLFLKYAADMDKIIKGAGDGNIWMSLQSFCLRLI